MKEGVFISYIAFMQIDYGNGKLNIKGRDFKLSAFKLWFKENYQPLMAKYHINKDTFDWHAILSDVQTNGIIQQFEKEN